MPKIVKPKKSYGGIRKYNKVVWTSEEDNKLKEYFGILKPKQLEQIFNLTYEQIRTRARTLKLKSNKVLQKEALNHKYFSTINNKSAYWAGFIMADGCVSDDNNFQMNLSIKDKAHLQLFSDEIFAGHKKLPTYGKRTNITFNSKEVAEDLSKNFNVIPRKTLIAKCPNLTIPYDKYFIAGLIDGDGFINVYKMTNGSKTIRFGLVGTKDVCIWSKQVLNNILKDKNQEETATVRLCNKNEKSKHDLYEVRVHGQNAQIVLDHIYPLVKDLCLRRKWNKYLEFSKDKIWERNRNQACQ